MSEEGRAAYEALYPAAPPDLAGTAERCGIDAARLERLAAEVGSAKRPLVMVGGSALEGEHGVAAGTAALALNVLLGALGREGGVFAGVDFGFEDRLAGGAESAAPTAALADRLADAGDAGVLVISEADPLYAMPGLEAAFGRTGTVIALSAFLDDTTRRADLVLPIQTDLERFQAVEPDPVRGVPALLIASPTVAPRGEARHPGRRRFGAVGGGRCGPALAGLSGGGRGGAQRCLHRDESGCRRGGRVAGCPDRGRPATGASSCAGRRMPVACSGARR